MWVQLAGATSIALACWSCGGGTTESPAQQPADASADGAADAGPVCTALADCCPKLSNPAARQSCRLAVFSAPLAGSHAEETCAGQICQYKPECPDVCP